LKKIVINILTFIVLVSAIVMLLLFFGTQEGARYVHKGNSSHTVIHIKPTEYQCSECNMDIQEMRYAVQLITKNGDTYFFDEIGCLVLWLKSHKVEIAKIFTKTVDTDMWIDAKSAHYSRIASTPMGYGFTAVEERSKRLISYSHMEKMMLEGKHLHDPFVKKKLLSK